jgi:predicted RNA methylase
MAPALYKALPDGRYVTFDPEVGEYVVVTAEHVPPLAPLRLSFEESKHPRNHGKFAKKVGFTADPFERAGQRAAAAGRAQPSGADRLHAAYEIHLNHLDPTHPPHKALADTLLELDDRPTGPQLDEAEAAARGVMADRSLAPDDNAGAVRFARHVLAGVAAARKDAGKVGSRKRAWQTVSKPLGRELKAAHDEWMRNGSFARTDEPPPRDAIPDAHDLWWPLRQVADGAAPTPSMVRSAAAAADRLAGRADLPPRLAAAVSTVRRVAAAALGSLRLSLAANPPAPAGDRGRKTRALMLMAMIEFQRRAHAVGMPEAAQPYLDHLAKLAGDPAAAKKAIRLSWQAVPLTRPSPNGRYQFKAVGDGPDAGKVLYGAEAQRAIQRQGERGTEARETDQRTAAAVGAPAPAADAHPEQGYSHKDYKAKQAAAGQAAIEFARGSRYKDITKEHLHTLAGHLPYLSVGHLRRVRLNLNNAFDASFGGTSKRRGMVDSLMGSVRKELDRMDAAAGAPVVDPPGGALPEAAAEPAAPSHQYPVGVPKQPQPGKAYRVPVHHLNVDPERFQFKLGTDKKGVTDEFKGVKFNPDLAGVLTAWRDPETGKDYVVNGHHRHELADRSGATHLNVIYSSAKTAKEARAAGALVNIAEGRGTAVDAAKFMRDSGLTAPEMQAKGVSLRGRTAEDAAHLAKLGDATFAKVARGQIDPNIAVAVAKHVTDEDRQAKLLDRIQARDEDGKDTSPKLAEAMARQMAALPAVKKDGADLFTGFGGSDEDDVFDERAILAHHVGSALAKEHGDWSAVASERRAGAVGDAGNTLNTDENQKRATELARTRETYNQLENRSGPISEALTAGAVDLKKAKTKKEKDDVRARTIESVRAAVRAEHAHLAAGGTGVPVEADARGEGAGAGGRGGLDRGDAEAQPVTAPPAVAAPPATEAPPAPAKPAKPAAPPAGPGADHHAAAASMFKQPVADLRDLRKAYPHLSDEEFGRGVAKLADGNKAILYKDMHPDNMVSGGYPVVDGERFTTFSPRGGGPSPADLEAAFGGGGNAGQPAAAPPAATKPAMSKAEAKAMVAALPVPESLPDNPADYFHAHEADATVPLDKIKNLRQRPEGVENAAKFMEASRRGLMPKRSPLKVVDNGDGTYTVADGNSTFANAKKNGWKNLPVKLVPLSYLHEEQRHTVEKEHVKAGGKMADDKFFTPEEMALPKKGVTSSENTQAGLYAAAEKAKPTFDRILDAGEGVEKALGASVASPTNEAEFNAAIAKPGPVVIVAPLKGAKRAAEKVQADYGGNWNQLHDIVRASVAVDTAGDIPKAMDALKKELAEKGWKLAKKPKNRFSRPTLEGYSDVMLNIVGPEGVVSEVQIHLKGMLKAKQEAHHLYEQERSLAAKMKTEGRKATRHEAAEMARLIGEQRKIYGSAWLKSLGLHEGEGLADEVQMGHLTSLWEAAHGSGFKQDLAEMGVSTEEGDSDGGTDDVPGADVPGVLRPGREPGGDLGRAEPAVGSQERPVGDGLRPADVPPGGGAGDEGAVRPAGAGERRVAHPGVTGSERIDLNDGTSFVRHHHANGRHVIDERPGGFSVREHVGPGRFASHDRGTFPTLDAAVTAAGDAPAPKSTNPHIALADALAAKLKAGETLTGKDVFALADEHHGGTRAEGKYGPSDAYDSLETAFNKSVAGQTDPTADLAGAQKQARQLADRVGKLPTQTNRSGNKDAFQQFSTPPHYAFAANWVANLKPTDTVLEPSAGTGSLAIHAKNAGARVVTNELDPRRAAFLKDQFGADAVHGENAEQIGALLHGKVAPSVVVMNPPFSQTAGRMGDKKDLHAGAKHIEQGLQLLPQNGRLVAIVGRGMTPESPTYRKWFSGLAKAGYTLKANVGVAGGEYKKYGTSFDTRLLVIDKVPPAEGHAPVTGDAEDVPDLMAKLEGVRNARPENAQPAPVGGAGAGVPQAAGGAGGPDAAGDPAAGAGVPDAGRPGVRALGGAGGVAGRGVPGGTAVAGLGGGAAGPGPGGGGGGGGGGPGDGGAGAAGAAGLPGGQPAGVQDGPGGGKAPRGKSVRKPSVTLPQLRPAAPLAVEAVPDAPAATAPDTTGKGGTAPKTNADLGDSLYEAYRPAKLRIPGAKPHASPLVESAAMSAVTPPAATYRPHLSPDLISQDKTVAVTNEDGSVSHIRVGLSEAGLESVVYAGQAHEKMLQAAEGAPAYRRGYFIGDGTGAGKGRQIAGIMTDNWNQGRKKHVWLTQKQSLINDARRDWRDVGNDPAHVVHFDDIRKGKPPPAEGIAFCTYDTLKSKPKDPAAPSNLDTLVGWLGKDFDGVIAFDEAHSMANALDTEGGRGVKSASERALTGVKLQQMLPNARVVYVSATGATELSNLAYAERLGLWGRGTPFSTKQDFIGQMEKGGVAAMEAVAQSLKATGGYAARSLSFDDGTPHGRVEYDRLTHSLSPDQHGTYDHLAEAWQKVLHNIDAALEVTGADKNGHAKAAAKSQFWGAQQRFFNQVMTSMQLPSVVKSMEADIAAGKAPVVQLVNTMEAATKRALDRSEDGDLDNIDVSPKEVLMQYLQKSFPVNRFEEFTDESGNVKTRVVMGADGKPAIDPQAVRIREEMLDMVGALNIPESPIDQLLRHFGHEHVAEATGRSQRFVWNRDPVTGEQVKSLDRRGANSNTNEARAFQGGKKKVMIFSDAGGTGSSYHADRNAANQKQRVHYVLQPGWRADNAVQGLGRTHRTNQVSAPIFRLVEIEQLKAQKRFVSTIARRLDQLGALTRGQRQAGSSGLFKAADNLESSEARDAMDVFFRELGAGRLEGLDNQDVMKQMGFWEEPSEEKLRRGKVSEPKTPDSMGQFLNRLLSLKVETQGKVFGHYERILNDTVERATANGTLDTGVENYPADRIRAKAERTIHTDKDSGAEAKLHTVTTSRKADKRAWKSTQEGIKPHFFVRNKVSGRVWAVYPAAGKTDVKTGSVTPQYVLRGPTASQFKDQSELYTAEHGFRGYGDAGNWEKIEHDTAKNLWEQEHAAAPDSRESEEHFVTGAFLPIWDKIPGGDKPRIYRVRTDDGKTVVGRHVPADQVEGLMRNLGLDYEGKKHTPAETHAAVARGDSTARLSNGWMLHPALVGGQRRIEVKGISPFAINEAVGDGVIKERVGGYDTRFFIPTGPDGLKVLERVLKSRNATIAAVTGKRDAAA